MSKTLHMTAAKFRVLVYLGMSETELQNMILKEAKRFGWRSYHTHDSRRSQAGFPDLVMTNGRRLIFAELKTQVGDPSDKQREWLADLETTDAEVYLWRPSDLDGAIAILSRKEA